MRSMETVLFFSPASSSDVREALAGAQDVAARRGFHLQTVEREPTARLVRELVRLWNPLGAIAHCGSSWSELDPAVFGSLPAVLLCHDPATLPSGTPSVGHASDETGRAAAQELLSTGFRRFAFVHNAERRHWSDVRGRAFAEAVRLHGFSCRVMGPSAAGEGVGAWQRRLRAFLRALPRPCALFAANDRTAAEVLAAARHERIAVPDELAVLGVDDDSAVCERAVPPLSSIAPDFRRAGALAAGLLLETAGRARGAAAGAARKAPLRTLEFGDLRLARRASTRPAAMRDPLVADALDRIRREACTGLAPADVAAMLPGTRRQADARFKRAVGRTIGAEIRAVRLAEVERLLADPARQIKAVGDFCGFSAPGSLRKFFRRETGLSMREWRKRRS